VIRFPQSGARLALVALMRVAIGGCSGGGIYADVGIAGPSIDLGPVSVRTGVSLGRWL